MTIATAGRDSIRSWSTTGVARVVQFATAYAGLMFPDNRREITEAAVRRAMARAGFKDADAFADRVAADPATLDAALSELTIGETYFFRDPGQWALIREEIVPDLLRRYPDGRGVRAWSAGCASGEEAYTLAIALREAGCVAPTVIGTDLAEHRLARAARAVYSRWSLRGVDAAAQHRYFRQHGQHFHLLPEFSDVRFRALNLIDHDYGVPGQELSELDLILCRNVLIYIEPESVDAIFERMVAALRPGGWLMVAASDPQPSPTLPLDVVVTNAGLLFRRKDPRAAAHVDVTRAPTHMPERTPAIVPRTHEPATRPVAIAPDVAPGPDLQLALRAYRAADYMQVVSVANALIAGRNDVDATWVLLVRAHANLGSLDEAERCCALGIARFPDAAELHVVQSAIQTQRERFAAAADAARRALYLDRSLAVAQLALGTALLRVGDNTAADRALRAAERMLAPLSPADIVRASDGATVYDVLSAVRAHRAMLEARGFNGV